MQYLQLMEELIFDEVLIKKKLIINQCKIR
jgi:hypothetical protein